MYQEMNGISATGLDSFDPQAVAEIRTRLDSVRAAGVRIGFAIESGSRAWGFPSPDSDYDCRFVYIRPTRDHLHLVPYRDVIEFPIVGDIDTGGWDLRKALLLALKGNAVLVEWIKSPIVYEEEPGFRARLSVLLGEIMLPSKVAEHYIGLLRQQWQPVDPAGAKLKKLLYAVRPAVALEWMRQTGFSRLPPMNLIECLAETDIEPSLKTAILDLIEVKKLTREMGEGAVPDGIALFVGRTMERFAKHPMKAERDVAREETAHQLADAFYQEEILQVKQ
jgi:predicted nucleotidyltransferase